MKKQLQFVCFPLDEEIATRVSLKRHIKYLGSFHCIHYCDMKKAIAIAARAYSLVCGFPVNNNHKLVEARLRGKYTARFYRDERLRYREGTNVEV